MRLVVTAVLLFALAAPAARAAEPTMLVIHGGAWVITGPEVTATLRPVADRFAAYGFRPQLVDYAPGVAGFADVVAAYDAAARAGGPVCAYGESAGGHWALMLAVARPGIACVIAAAAPTDFADTAALGLRDLAQAALGPDLVDLTPLGFAPAITAPTLFAAGFDDRLVPPGQAGRMAAAVGGPARVVELPPGSEPWMHGTAAPEAIARLHATERAFAVSRTFGLSEGS